MPAGQGKLGWVDIRDIAAVNAEILKNPNAYVNQELTITGAENLSFEDALAIVSSVLDKKVNYVDVSENAAIQAMKDYGMPDFVIEMTSSLNKIIKAGYAEGVTETVEKITGKQPISFRQFVEDYKENWQ